MIKLVCWPDAELILKNGEYLLKENDSGSIFCRFYADNQVDAICIAASRYGIYSTIKALHNSQSNAIYLH